MPWESLKEERKQAMAGHVFKTFVFKANPLSLRAEVGSQLSGHLERERYLAATALKIGTIKADKSIKAESITCPSVM